MCCDPLSFSTECVRPDYMLPEAQLCERCNRDIMPKFHFTDAFFGVFNSDLEWALIQHSLLVIFGNGYAVFIISLQMIGEVVP